MACFILIIIYFTLSSSSLVKNNVIVNATSALEARIVIKEGYAVLANKKRIKQFSASESELKSLSALLQRAYPYIISSVELDKSDAKINLSVKLPFPQIIQYLNINTLLLSSNSGLKLSDITIGAVSIPSEWALHFFIWTVNHFVQPELGEKMLAMVTSVKVSQQRVYLNFELPPPFNDNNDINILFALRDKFALFGDAEHTNKYYKVLTSHIEVLENTEMLERLFLGYYVRFMLNEAKKNNLQQPDLSFIDENRAALMALSIYLGSDKFELMVGNMSKLTVKQRITRQKIKSSLQLKGRVDLQKHFIYSVAIQLFSTSGASDAVGEFKELLDSNTGGSGFSFADLMADRAGTRLAMIATKDELSARKCQELLSNMANDDDIMPNLLGLPEGLNQVEFEENYRNIISPQYLKMINDIDLRLVGVPLYTL